jgi:mannose-6-phosphate isomerase-like protein (cupin superfamily)
VQGEIIMPVLKNSLTPSTETAPGVYRKFIHLDGLLTAIIDFTNGPWTEPEPRHNHPHEQTSYVAKGELMVFIGDEEHKLEEGDIFTVPSNVPHTVQILSREARLIDSFQPVREDFLG